VIAVLYEIDQQVEDLRFEGDQSGAVPQLAPIKVEHILAKGEFRLGSPRDRSDSISGGKLSGAPRG
jgi:hypothetical protein